MAGQVDTASTPPPFPLPTILTYPSASPPTLIAQGAEGRLYRTTFLTPDLPCALKYRPTKPYRHPILDARLTRARILAETRVLARCQREGVPVPAVYAADDAAGWIMMEWVEGLPVRARLNAWLAERRARSGAAGPEAELAELHADPALRALMRRAGAVVGGIHRVGVVHGDLTTSNMMLRPRAVDPSATNGAGEHGAGAEDGLLDGEIVVIDFGLATQSTHDEDRAVDLYVLERAFASTHPRAEALFSELLAGYKDAFKQAGPVLRKLEDVRMRGRKRSMLG